MKRSREEMTYSSERACNGLRILALRVRLRRLLTERREIKEREAREGDAKP